MRMVTRKRSHDAEPSTTRRLTKTIHYNHRLVGSTTKTTGVEDEVIRPWIAVKLLERTKEIVDLMLLKWLHSVNHVAEVLPSWNLSDKGSSDHWNPIEASTM